ncbi:MAG: GNAT family N-acetyltransferase [Gemmatimonadetes bacterium]|nr:GNAT family N-acetyltransferase [Gemmatimonadota bacterium]
MIVRSADKRDREWIDYALDRWWGSTRMISRGVDHDLLAQKALIAERAEEPVGLLVYRLHLEQCEVISLNSAREDHGIGTALLAEVERLARDAGCARIWLVTSNDNLRAIGFYQRRGYTIAAVHRNAIAEARRRRPSIPEIGLHNIPLRDEIEFEKTFS